MRRRGCAVVAFRINGGRCGNGGCSVERVRRGKMCLATAAVAAAEMCLAVVADVAAELTRLSFNERGRGPGSGGGRAAWAGCTAP